MQRFELLNSGYNAPATLSSIDGLISDHAAELAIAMGTLSNNASSTKNRKSSGGSGGGPEFDEQHVHCALEILRIAGQFKRNLLSFERSVKDRLMVLSNDIFRVGTLFESDDSVIPEELAPVQIRAFLAKAACDLAPDSTRYVDNGTGVKCPTTVVQLQRLAGQDSSVNKDNGGSTSPPLFPKSLDATSRLSRACLSFIFEVCYAIPERQLHGISALPVWKQDGGGGSAEDDETSYGILPQPFITHVGEHMLALVQALEPFASDAEALGLANEVMANVLDVAVQPWKEFVAAAGCSFETTKHSTATGGESEKRQLEMFMRGGKDLEKYFLDENSSGDDSAQDEDIEHEEEEEEEEDARASAAFCNQWLDVVSLAVTGRLLERTMRVPRLGRKGAEHLATDLNYIMNVFTALGVHGHPHPLLGYVAQLATLEDGMLRERIRRRRQQEIGDDAMEDEVLSEALMEVIRRTELRIAHVRNISV